MVRKYLDGVSQVLLQRITKAERSTFKKFLSFWLKDLPIALYNGRRSLTVSAIIFLVSISIGVISSIYEPEFARTILGDGYVNMTNANIESGDPMAVYKEFYAFDGFMQITIHNTQIALLTFMFGVLYAIGTVLVLIINGIMLGAFQYFFIEQDLFWESFLTIWQHGTLEISAIIIAGGAGITMGRGLIYPGFYSRLQSFKISGKHGLMMFLGTVPLLIMAGFIEGFLTRHTEFHWILRLSVIITSLAFILYYYSWYPRFVHKRVHSVTKEQDEFIAAEKRASTGFYKNVIFPLNSILRSVYSFSALNSLFIWVSLILAIITAFFMLETIDWRYITHDVVDSNPYPPNFGYLWTPSKSPIVLLIMSFSALLLSMFSHYKVDKKKKEFLEYFSFLKLAMSLSFWLLLISPWLWFIVIPIYLILNFLGSNSSVKEKTAEHINLFRHGAGAFRIFGSVVVMNGVLLGCFYIFYLLILFLLHELLFDDLISYAKIVFGFQFSIWMLFLYCTHFMITAGNYYSFYSEEERSSAEGLLKRVSEFKLKYYLKGE